MRQELLRNKYHKNRTLSHVEANPPDSPFWKGLRRVKYDFFERCFFEVGNGSTGKMFG
jgi:hypothetical protein